MNTKRTGDENAELLISIVVIVIIAFAFVGKGGCSKEESPCAKAKSDYYNARYYVKKYGNMSTSEISEGELATYSHYKYQYDSSRAELERLGCDYTP